MSEQQMGNALQIAQELIDHLPKEMKDINGQLKSLFLRARDGQDPIAEMELIDLLSSLEVTRRLLERQTDIQSGVQKDITLGDGSSGGGSGWVGSGLAGNIGRIPFSQRWICPIRGCDLWLLVIQEGEDAPLCEQHNIRMARGGKTNG